MVGTSGTYERPEADGAGRAGKPYMRYLYSKGEHVHLVNVLT